MDKLPTKVRILHAALDVFAEKGYDGVGVDLIAQQAGLKGPSLYKHYKGKEDILNALIVNVEEYYSRNFQEAGNTGEEPPNLEAFVAGCMAKINFTMHDDTIQKIRKVLAMEQFRNSLIAELTTKHYYEGQQKMFVALFKRMMERGIMRADDPEVVAMEFVAPVSLMIHTYDRQPEKEAEVMKQIKAHMEHFVKEHGVRPMNAE